ncbi:MAG: MFS transporter, partial [Phycisphaerales bacterium]|nr:MFS transporter [Phycisphaerales bacterium]
MKTTAILLLIAFIESFVTILNERGVYFFCKDRLGFDSSMNLWLALTFGAGYVLTAWGSHWLSSRIGERRQLLIVIAVLVAVHAWLYFWVSPLVMFVAMALLGLANGAKWPVLEGFLASGLTPGQTARIMGKFNICWATAIPLALIATGPLIAISPTLLFLVGGVISLVSLCLTLRLPHNPAPPKAPDLDTARHEHPA